MKKLLMPIIIFVSTFMAGCKKYMPVEHLPQAPAQIVFTSHNLFPEGLAFDPLHNLFLVSSAAQGTVGMVPFNGTWKLAVTDGALTMTTGLKVDKKRKLLWVCDVLSGVGVFDLISGKKIFFANLTSVIPGEPLFLNDVVIDQDGNAYVTNSAYPVIYKVDKYGNSSVFFQDNSFATNPGEFGFNGIQLDAENGFLLVAHTSGNQILKIPITDKSNYKVVSLNTNLSYPDGLLLSRDGKQLVVVSDDRVLSFISNDQWQSGSQSTSFVTGPVFASSLTSDGKRVFVIYSHLDMFLSGQDQEDFTIREVVLQMPGNF